MSGPRTHPLESAWAQLLASLGATPASCAATFADLAAHYGAAERHYHTLEHVADVLGTLHSLCPDAGRRPALLLAGWLHDVVYDTRASDNEERSAAHARALLRGVPGAAPLLDEMERLILLTRGHLTAAGDSDGQVLLDADLAVLGAEPDDYDRYARAIRQEYAWVPPEQYRVGRARVLEGFLRRPRIYATEAMFERAEIGARHNLQRELVELRG
jgi:predicted metal-dependent HD superfamily phosphohydrolase